MVHRLQFHAMGTEMLVCVDNGSGQVPAELADVPVWFEEWEQTLSRFRIDSELTWLNRTGSQPVAVSETLWQVFQAAVSAEKNTEGLVTPTIARSMLEAGYDRDFNLFSGLELGSMESAPSMVRSLDDVTWNESTRSICLPLGVQLDFGGIAKGWAAGQVVQRLNRHGSALMNCGGDIAIGGPLLDGSLWEVGIHKPFDRSGGYIGTMYFDKECGVATSATDRRRWMQGGNFRHHIIDPDTGVPAASDVLSATVVAPNAVEAEAAAKSALIRGSADGLDWVDANPGLACLLILEDGRVLYSRRIRDYL